MMYLDRFPDLAQPAAIKARSRGVPIRDNGRAAAVAFVSDGSMLPTDTIVRFEVAKSENPARRLGEAFAATGAKVLWFYGGDAAAWRAAVGLDLTMTPWAAVMVRAVDRASDPALVLRRPTARDRLSLADMHEEHAPFFRAPDTQLAESGTDSVGAVFSETLDAHWTELRALVHPAMRGRGFGAAILTEAANRLETGGRAACAFVPTENLRARAALEGAGFRVADYFFTARRTKAT
jgi:GNAT superfamily N-acetyltransferase